MRSLYLRLGLAGALGLSACARPHEPVFVSFDTGVDTPRTPGELLVVGTALEALKRDPDVSAAIIGHADATGGARLNKELSLRRARKVRELLLDQGIAAGRLVVAARGADAPIATNETDEGRAKNRRTEVFFYYPSRGDLKSQYHLEIEVHAE
jgi:outer membrane protein OmpA-like peptidoglycan-associated protein